LCELAAAIDDPPRESSLFEESIAIFRQVGDTHGLVKALAYYGLALTDQRNYEKARAVCEECVALAHKANVGAWAALSRSGLALIAFAQGNYTTAQSMIEKILRYHRTTQFRPAISFCNTLLGNIAYVQDDYEQARVRYNNALEATQEGGGHITRVHCLLHLGHIALHQHKRQEAQARLIESLFLSQKREARWLTAGCLIGIAALWEQQGQPEQAAQLLSTAEPFLKTIPNLTESVIIQIEYDRTAVAVRSALGEQTFAAAAKGREMTLEDAIAFALADSTRTEGGGQL
jgi:tetratricopeptide (TPR) repeat protein